MLHYTFIIMENYAIHVYMCVYSILCVKHCIQTLHRQIHQAKCLISCMGCV